MLVKIPSWYNFAVHTLVDVIMVHSCKKWRILLIHKSHESASALREDNILKMLPHSCALSKYVNVRLWSFPYKYYKSQYIKRPQNYSLYKLEVWKKVLPLRPKQSMCKWPRFNSTTIQFILKVWQTITLHPFDHSISVESSLSGHQQIWYSRICRHLMFFFLSY